MLAVKCRRRLSCLQGKCLRLHGFSAVAIDHKKCKNRVGPCIVLDLSKSSSVEFMKGKIDQGNVFFIPWHPRVAQHRGPKWLHREGVSSPPPLRSAEYPSGLPDLSGQNLTRVTLANACHTTAAEVFKYGHAKQVYVFIENPKNSYMWMVPCIAELFFPRGRVLQHSSRMHAWG